MSRVFCWLEHIHLTNSPLPLLSKPWLGLANLEGYNLGLKMLDLRVLSLDRGPAARDLQSGAHSPGLPMLELGIHLLDWDFSLLSLLRTCSVRFPGTLVCKNGVWGKRGL